MKRILAGAGGAFALAMVALSSGAQAQCFWDGFGTACVMPPAVYTSPFWATPYPAFNSFDYQDYRLRPYWLPSYPGPRPGGR